MALPPTTELDTRAKHQLGLMALLSFGPLAWFLDLLAVYAVSSHECDVPTFTIALTIAGVLLTALALALSVALQRRPHDRQRAFLIELALMLNALALLLTLGFIAPVALLRPCE
jgi:hypothetical protein